MFVSVFVRSFARAVFVKIRGFFFRYMSGGIIETALVICEGDSVGSQLKVPRTYKGSCFGGWMLPSHAVMNVRHLCN